MFIFNISLGIAAGFSHVFSFGVLADFARNAAENSSGISQAISSGISPRIARIQHCAMIFFFRNCSEDIASLFIWNPNSDFYKNFSNVFFRNYSRGLSRNFSKDALRDYFVVCNWDYLRNHLKDLSGKSSRGFTRNYLQDFFMTFNFMASTCNSSCDLSSFF